MDNQGYTRRDHKRRRRYSKNRSELLLDKLLKIFFGILVVLVVIIVIKVAFGGKNNNSTDESTTPVTGTNEDDASTSPLDEQSSSLEDSSNDSGETTTPPQTTTEPTTTPEPTTTTEPPTTTTEAPTTTKQEEEVTEPSTTYTAVGDYSVFNNSAFVGDSRIGGLYLSSQLTTSTFYYDVGGNVSSAVNTDSVLLKNGTYGTMIDALKQGQYDNIFIQYGVNEFGWSADTFASKYETFINEIKAVQPNAKIYVLAIIPVTAKFAVERTDGAYNVNDRLDQMDAKLKTMAESNGVTYLNIVEAITGGERVLQSYMSSDGYHLNKSYNLKVLDYICNAIK